MAKHTLKILIHTLKTKIFKVCLAILQHYAWKGYKERCFHEIEYLDMHEDFFIYVCDSVDTILYSCCVASNKINFS